MPPRHGNHRLRYAVTLAGVLFALTSREASAAPASRSVVVEIVGGDDTSVLEATIRELLARSGVTMSSNAAKDPTPLAVVAIDRRDAGFVHVVITTAEGRVVARRDVSVDAGPSITREAVAHAVLTAVEARLLEAEEPPSAPAPPPSREEPPRQERTPDPPPVAVAVEAPPPSDGTRAGPRHGLALDVTTFVGASAISEHSGVSPRVGASMALARHAKTSMWLALSGSYAFPVETRAADVTAHASFTALRVGPGLEVFRTRSVSLGGTLSGGIDIVNVEPRSEVLPVSVLTRSSTHVDIIASAMVEMRIPIASGVMLQLGAGAEVDLFTRPYVVARGGERVDLLSPWRVRPLAVVGLSFTTLGPSCFAGGG